MEQRHVVFEVAALIWGITLSTGQLVLPVCAQHLKHVSNCMIV
jgi:hypothetical protein